jgi:histone H3/H4
MMWKDEVMKEVRETKDASQALMKALADVRAELVVLASRETVSPSDVAEVVKELDDNQKEMIAAVFEGTPAEPSPEEAHAAGM